MTLLDPQDQVPQDRFQHRKEHLMTEINTSNHRTRRFGTHGWRVPAVATVAVLVAGGAYTAQAHGDPRTDDTQLKGGAIDCTAASCVQQAAAEADVTFLAPPQDRLKGTEINYYYDDFGNFWAAFAYGSTPTQKGRITLIANRGTRRTVPQPSKNTATAVRVQGAAGRVALWVADPKHGLRPGGWVVWSEQGWTYKLAVETRPGDDTSAAAITRTVIKEANTLRVIRPTP